MSTTSNAPLDFSVLTDDQLIELIRAALEEAVRRGDVTRAAAQSVMLDEAERARIAGEAARAEAERIRRDEERRIAEEAAERVRQDLLARQRAEAKAKQDRLWTLKSYLGRMVTSTLGSKWALTVWERDGERRVYLDKLTYGKVSYFHTGNHRNKPGNLVLEGVDGKYREELRVICQEAARLFSSAKFDCDQAASMEVETEPAPAAYTEARQVRLEADEKARRIELESAYGGEPVAAVAKKRFASEYAGIPDSSDGILVVRSFDDPARAQVRVATILGTGSSRNPKYVCAPPIPKPLTEFTPPSAWPADVRAMIPADILAALDSRLASAKPLDKSELMSYGTLSTKVAQ